MTAIGREVEMVGIPLAEIEASGIPAFEECRDIFGYDTYYSAEKLYRDVPEFRPRVSLEQGIRQVIEAMDNEGRIPNSDDIEWEDRIIAAQRST